MEYVFIVTCIANTRHVTLHRASSVSTADQSNSNGRLHKGARLTETTFSILSVKAAERKHEGKEEQSLCPLLDNREYMCLGDLESHCSCDWHYNVTFSQVFPLFLLGKL